MPEILILPSRATRRTYPLHLRIVCALVEKLADLQVSMQHAHTARLVRNFPARYAPVERVERMQVQRDGDQIKVSDTLAEQDSAQNVNLPPVNMNELIQAQLDLRDSSLLNAYKAEGEKNLNKLFHVQQNPGHDPIYTPVTELEKDFEKMRAEVAQLLEDALSTEDLSRKNKENPSA